MINRTIVLGVVVVLVVSAGVAVAAGDDEAGPAFDRPTPEATRLILAIDNAQLCHAERRGGYTDSLEDLLEVSGGLPLVLASDHRIDVELSASRGGRSYFVRLRGDDFDTYLERRGPDFVNDGAGVASRVGDRCDARRR